MRITADTNVLLRAVLDDDPAQGAGARESLAKAERIAITIVTLCEVVWVLRSLYRRSLAETAALVRQLIRVPRISLDDEAVQAGLTMMDTGGDFADGVIAFEGRRLGGDVFVTFDRQAAELLERAGAKADLLGAES